MRALIQRVLNANVTIDGQTVATIGSGLLVFLGVTATDTEEEVKSFAARIVNMRIFEDDQHKMNRTLADVHGEILLVSQFTLYGNPFSGRRPDFINAAKPDIALPLYQRFIDELTSLGHRPQTGQFGADMKVSLTNDGPVTMWMDSNHH